MTHPAFTVDNAISGQLVIKPESIKSEWRFSNGTATLEAGTKHESLFYYVLKSESEQQAFLQLHEVVRLRLKGPLKNRACTHSEF